MRPEAEKLPVFLLEGWQACAGDAARIDIHNSGCYNET